MSMRPSPEWSKCGILAARYDILYWENANFDGIDYTQNKCERDGSGRMRTYPVPSECTRWTSGTRITLVYFTSNRHVTASADARSFLQTKCPLPSPVSARCSYWFLRYFAACPEVCLKIPVSRWQVTLCFRRFQLAVRIWFTLLCCLS